MGRILDGILFIVGVVIASALDIAAFCAVAAIPLAALVYLSVISQGTAMVVLTIVAIIVTLRVVLVSALKAL